MKAFKAILFEMGSNSLDNALRQNVGTSGTNRRGGKSSIAKAKNFSNLYYTTKEGENEFNIYTMKNFTLDSVQNMRSEIKESMDEERISLEKEIVKYILTIFVTLAWALKAAAFAFCFLKAKTAFFSSPKAVKSCKNPAFLPIYCILNL